MHRSKRPPIRSPDRRGQAAEAVWYRDVSTEAIGMGRKLLGGVRALGHCVNLPSRAALDA
jgi:hypothetical protein